MIEMSNRLNRIDQQIHEAMRMIDLEKGASPDTKEAVHQFVDKSEATLQELNKNRSDEKQIVDRVFELEELADRAKDCVRRDQRNHSLKPESFQAVIDAHNSVSNLKHELRGDANRH